MGQQSLGNTHVGMKSSWNTLLTIDATSKESLGLINNLRVRKGKSFVLFRVFRVIRG
jgi:hypothetical protein